jgi:hypothetical protein
VSPVAYPLDDFYARAGLPLPVIEVIAGTEIPEPYRHLLVHGEDMTSTLQRFHGGPIGLHLLSSQLRDNWYFREVVLTVEGQETPVEFGAIRISLALFPPAVRHQILEERIPLGRLLRQHSVPHASRPKAFFRIEADSLMIGALGLRGPATLFGRRNTLLDSVRRPLAEVVEILPPAGGRHREERPSSAQ